MEKLECLVCNDSQKVENNFCSNCGVKLYLEKRKLSENEKRSRKRVKLLQYTWKTFSVIGLFTLVVYILILFFGKYIDFDSRIDLGKTGAFGDFIGGIVGTLWAFASVLLFNLSLMLQRKELQLTRVIMNSSNETQEETRLILSKQLQNLEYRTKLEALSNLIVFGGKALEEIKTGKYLDEDIPRRNQLEKDISIARKQLSQLSKEITKI